MKAEDHAREYRKSSGPYGSRRRSRRRSGPSALVLVVLVVGAALAAFGFYLLSKDAPRQAELAEASATLDPAANGAERTAALPPLSLPADDAPHGSRMEWWYYNGILSTSAGQRYAFHVALFVTNSLLKQTALHVALTDLQTGKRFISQNRTAGVPGRDVTDGFDFEQDGWRVSGSGAVHALRAALDGASLTLDLKDANAPVAHRAAGSKTPGLIDFGKSGISYYYSRPRMAANGEVTIDGKPMKVSGEVWFDHQWGDFDVLNLGWNWFALHLKDGSDVMLYALFDNQGKTVATAGTVSNAQGSRPLSPGDIEATPVGRWTSPATKITYPVEWRIKLPGSVLEVKPRLPDSEFDSSTTTANIYWEGPVNVSGSAEGEGFMELSGYDRLPTMSGAR